MLSMGNIIPSYTKHLKFIGCVKYTAWNLKRSMLYLNVDWNNRKKVTSLK